MCTKEDVCKAAAKWWRDVISDSKFDNGDASEVGLFTKTLAYMLADKNKATKEQLDSFEEELCKILLTEENHVCLMVDYNPCKMLCDVANLSNISTSLFPYKTLMDINFDNGTIFVKNGYGARLEELSIKDYLV